MSKKNKTVKINVTGLIQDLIKYFSKKNWLHTDDFDEMIKKNTIKK